MQLDPGSEYRVFTWLAIWLVGVQKALRMKRAGRGNMDICQEARVWKHELKEKPMSEVNWGLIEQVSRRFDQAALDVRAVIL